MGVIGHIIYIYCVRLEVIIMYSLAWRSEGFHHGHDLLRAVLPGSGDHVSVGGKLLWLDFLYVASYVKLAITLIKYIPQVSPSPSPHQIHTTGEP